MADLVYSAIASLDGYVADEAGDFSWAAPGEEVHRFVNELERAVGTYLYGRRLYDVMVAWEDPDVAAGQPPHLQEYADIWRSADKVVYSRTLQSTRSARTRVERELDPAGIRRLKASTDRDVSVGGPGLAAQALEVGLVDELRLFLTPVVVGGGTPALPSRLRLALELRDERRFADGVVYLAYRVVG